MTTTIPTTEPSQVRAGDTVKWTRLLSDYDPATWILSYALRGLPGKIDITASDNGDGSHLVSVTPATSTAWEPGIYSWAAQVTDGTDVYTVDHGTIEVLDDLSAISGVHDGRTHAKKVLDAIEAVLENRATKDQESYSIAGRSLSRTSIADLLKLRDRYRGEYVQEIRAEKGSNDEGHHGRILVRFV